VVKTSGEAVRDNRKSQLGHLLGKWGVGVLTRAPNEKKGKKRGGENDGKEGGEDNQLGSSRNNNGKKSKGEG